MSAELVKTIRVTSNYFNKNIKIFYNSQFGESGIKSSAYIDKRIESWCNKI